MVTKQNILNDIKSELFNIDIYDEYVEYLIEINLELLNMPNNKFEEKKRLYRRLIDMYIKGQINDPDQILKRLKVNLHSV
jgi:hypothetical protein